MATNYPSGLDNFPPLTDGVDVVAASHQNDRGDAIEAIEAELGLNPSGASATVAARLDAVDAAVAGKLATGGTAANTAAVGGVIVSGAPAVGQVLKATSTTAATWQPDATGSGGGSSVTIDADGTISDGTITIEVALDADVTALAASTTASLAGKAATSHTHSTADLNAGTLPLARGGTGGTDASTARTSLGLGTAATQAATAFAPVAAVAAVLGSPSTATTGTLVAGQMALADATSAALARTLPAANSVAAGTVTGLKKIDGSANAVTVSRAGTDTITGTAAGQTSRALTLAGESVEFTSDGASVWVVTSTDTPSPALAITYAPLASPALTGNPTAPTPAAGDNDASIATTAFVATATSLNTVRPLPGVPVATNCYYQAQVGVVPNGSVGTNGTSRSKHRATTTFTDPVLVYGNATGGNTGETDGADTYTIRAAVEWNGIILPVTFNGSRNGTCSPGGLLISDPVPVEFATGTDFRVRTYVTADGTTAVQSNTASNPGTGQGFATGDLTAVGAAAIADSYSFLYAPHAILGQPVTPGVPTVGLVGDSIMCGTGDTAASTPITEWANSTSAQAGGFALRALARNFGYVHIGAGAERATHFAARHRRAVLLSTCKYFLCSYGTNDLYAGGQSVAATQAGLVGTWLTMRRRGPVVYQTTITPQTSSTDSWATTGNQTALSGNANRVTVNDWIRDGAPVNSSTLVAVATGTVGALRAGQPGHPLAGYFEVADTVESARNSGAWKAPGFTADGVHPSTIGHTAMAGAINTTLFV